MAIHSNHNSKLPVTTEMFLRLRESVTPLPILIYKIFVTFAI